MDEFGSAFEKLVGGMILAVVHSLVDGGVTPTRAAGLAGPALIVGALGRDVLLDMGVPLRTVQKWQMEARNALASTDVEAATPPAAVVNKALAAMGFPLRVVEP